MSSDEHNSIDATSGMVNTPAFSFTGLIISWTEKTDGSADVVIEPNLFYPGGGGQPCDQGVMSIHGRDAQVLSCHKTENGEGELKKILNIRSDATTTPPAIGTRVSCSIDAVRRISLTRAHSAEHILFKSIQIILTQHQGKNQEAPTTNGQDGERIISVKKVDLDISESSLFVNTSHLSWEDLFAAEILANHMIAEDRLVIERRVTKDEFITEQHGKYQGIRIKLDRIKDSTIRIVEVKDFDYSACAGTHVEHTSEIGLVYITKFQGSGPGEFEIRFSTGPTHALRAAEQARRSATMLGISVDELSTDTKRLIELQATLQERIRFFERDAPMKLESHTISEGSALWGLVVASDRKILIDKVTAVLKQGDVALVGSQSNPQDTPQLHFFSKNLHINAGELFRNVAKSLPSSLTLKGGGKVEYAGGAISSNVPTAPHLLFEAVRIAFLTSLKVPESN